MPDEMVAMPFYFALHNRLKEQVHKPTSKVKV